jgi:hypothetical protein
MKFKIVSLILALALILTVGAAYAYDQKSYDQKSYDQESYYEGSGWSHYYYDDCSPS